VEGGEHVKSWKDKQDAARKRRADRQIAAAMRNDHVRIGHRDEPGGQLRGVYATRDFAAGDVVASFHGRIVTRQELVKLHGSDRPLFEKICEYAVWDEARQGHLYPEDLDAVGAHLVNHACAPNAAWGPVQDGARLVVASRPIAKGQEITLHYGWLGAKAALEGRHPCSCGVAFCTGTIELYVEMVDDPDGRTSAIYLPPEEVAERMLVDIVHGCVDNELLVIRYGQGVTDMMLGSTVAQGIDPVAFFEKLRAGASVAVKVARMWSESGNRLSEERLQQIAERYWV